MMLQNRAFMPFNDEIRRLNALRLKVWRRLLSLGEYPLLSVSLSVLGFAFLGPVAALVLVATMLDHEFAHRYVMRKLGYQPGPVRMIPLVGAYVRARRPMLRSADIALIYLAGPLIGVLSATLAAIVAGHTLDPMLQHQVYVGATVSVALNLFNLLPLEPLDGGLVSRVLPYPCLLLFPAILAVGLIAEHRITTPIGIGVVLVAAWLTLGKLRKWRHYVKVLRAREITGDLAAVRELLASFEVPLMERLLVVLGYALLVMGATALLLPLARAAHWLQ